MTVLFQLKDHFKENQLYLNRAVAATTMVIGLFLILIIRLAYLQISQHDVYATQARNNQVRILTVTPNRGLIFDRNGVPLATNIPNFSLEIIPNRVKNLTKLIDEIKTIIPISDTEIANFKKQVRLKNKFESIPIKAKLTEEEVAKFSVVNYKYPAADIAARLTRNYPHGEELAHVLGYLGPINEKELYSIDTKNYRGTHVIGKTGIEKSYEDLLHGTVGYEQVETDARGRIVRDLSTESAVPGKNVYLTLDINLQKQAYNALGDNRGAVVMLDIKTGGLLALVSKPSFDPNLFIRGIEHKTYQKLQQARSQPLFNRAIRGQYSPGSTVKPILALQALDKELIRPKTRIFDPGHYKISEETRLFRCWKNKGHGFINLEDAIAQSCTTYFYFVAEKLGIDLIHDSFTKFGLGQISGIDINGEADGLAPSVNWKRTTKNENWFTGETLIAGIGQGYTLATPLQIAQMAATIANRGVHHKPHLLQATQDSLQTEIVNEEQTDEVQVVKIENDKHWDTIIRAMEKTVKSNYGTAHRIYRKHQPAIAGKTGTTQVFGLKQDETYDVDKIQESLRDHSWFMAFSPVKNPEVAIAVIIENNKGSSIVARDLFTTYFNNKDTNNG